MQYRTLINSRIYSFLNSKKHMVHYVDPNLITQVNQAISGNPIQSIERMAITD